MLVVKHALKQPSRNISVIYVGLNVTSDFSTCSRVLFVMKFRKMYILSSLVRYMYSRRRLVMLNDCLRKGGLNLVKAVYRPCC